MDAALVTNTTTDLIFLILIMVFHLIQSLMTHCHFPWRFERIMKNDFNPSRNWFK